MFDNMFLHLFLFIGLQVHDTCRFPKYGAFYAVDTCYLLSLSPQNHFCPALSLHFLTDHPWIVYSHEVPSTSLCPTLITSCLHSSAASCVPTSQGPCHPARCVFLSTAPLCWSYKCVLQHRIATFCYCLHKTETMVVLYNGKQKP